MTGRRISPIAAALCGLGALALLLSTFLGWYPAQPFEPAYFNGEPGTLVSDGDDWLNAWQAFTVVDLVLAVCVAVGAWAAATLIRRGASEVAGGAALAAGAAGLGLVIWRTLDPATGFDVGVDVGPVIAASALTATAAGGAVALATARG